MICSGVWNRGHFFGDQAAKISPLILWKTFSIHDILRGKKGTDNKGAEQKGRRAKRSQSKKGSEQKGLRAKRSQSKKGAEQKGREITMLRHRYI